jgi:glycosyltransferase involved in cell wall biosynthesis
MRIIIDASVLCLRRYTKGGQQRYTREVLRHLDTVGAEDSYVLWFNFINPANLPLYEQACRELSETKLRHRTVLCRIPPQVLEPLRVPVELFTGAADLFHAPTAAAYYTWRARHVVTIHDLAYFDHPECFDFPDIERSKRHVKWLANRAAMVLTVSEHARETIIERLGVSPDRVRVTYHGVSRIFYEEGSGVPFEALQTRFGIRKPYILFVSTIQPNKNVVRLLEAFDLLRRAELKGWQLVLAGQRGWLTESIFAKADALAFGDDLVVTGFVEEEALPTLYRHAGVFVLPSLVEGFGIPVIEAMACGAPVVVSKSGALPEIAGDAGELVDPYSVEDIARGILAVATDPARRDRLIARGKARAEQFRWEQTARETVAAYRDAAGMR